MKSTKKSTVVHARREGPSDPAVDAVFNAYPRPLKAKLLALRRLILDAAAATKGVGELRETLKWGQPSYLTAATKSGSTIRIDQVKGSVNQYALYFHCQTDLVATFRELYPNELTCAGNRAIIFNANDAIPEAALSHCIGLALTYHSNKRKSRNAN